MKSNLKWNFLAFYGITLTLSITLAEGAAWLMLFAWVAMLFKNKSWSTLRPSTLDVPFLCFAIWNVAIVLFTGSTSFINSISYTSPFLLFYWAAHDLSPEEVRRLGAWYCWGAAAVGLWGILQCLSGVNYMPNEKTYFVPDFFKSWPSTIVEYLAVRNERAVGPRSHPLTYAECFIPAFFVLFAGIFSRKNGKWNWKMAIGCALVGGGVLLSQSRAVWVGLFMGVLLYIMVSKRWKLLWVVALVVAIGGPTILAVSPSLRNRVSSIFSRDAGRSGDQLSKSTRFELWHSALVLIHNQPWTGVGLKGAKFIGIDPVTRQLRTWTESHNDLLQITVENGFVGLGLYIWLWVLLVLTAVRLKPPNREIFCSILLAFFIAGLTESWSRDKEVSILFWLTMGLMENLRRHEA